MEVSENKIKIGHYELTEQAFNEWKTWNETKAFMEFIALYMQFHFDKLKVALLAGTELPNSEVLQASLQMLNMVRNTNFTMLAEFNEGESDQ